MKSILIKAYMCADILSNYIEDLDIIEISVLNYKDTTPAHLIPAKYKGAEYYVKIVFKDKDTAEFCKALHRARQAIYKVIDCGIEPTRDVQESGDFRNVQTFVLLTA